jgi:hypothetical protein
MSKSSSLSHTVRTFVLVGALATLTASLWLWGFKHANAAGDDISGTVTSSKGPEAGVWVIAETKDLPTTYRKIVVTDDQGRYVIPQLPSASYDVFVRGYGLVDSARVKGTPGATLNLKVDYAPTPQAAAQIYPPNYWWSLLEVPPASDFPGTGTGSNGNGINARMKTQADWTANASNCALCHQFGDKATREIEPSLGAFDSSVEAWDRRTMSGQSSGAMINAFQNFGRKDYLQRLASWSDRIKAGEVPPMPPRPQGLERNVVLTIWDWADQYSFIHDVSTTEQHKPTMNAYGKVYGVSRFSRPDLLTLDPMTSKVNGMVAPIRDKDTPTAQPQSQAQPSPYWGDELIWKGQAAIHDAQMDDQGRVWMTQQFRKDQPAYCNDGSILSSKLYPIQPRQTTGAGRQLSVYDPKEDTWGLIDTCFGTHHLEFSYDKDNTLWFSGGGDVLGWVNTRLYDQTHDSAKSQGWTPYILDTIGNGKRGAYVGPNDPIDPKKDKQITPGSYGIAVNPIDNSIWIANARPIGGAIMRVVPGANPAETALTEIYEPPPPGTFPRGIDVDTHGLVWTALAGSGQIASFDRSKCKVLNGPTATGQQCPEGWTLYPVPGPKFKNGPDEAAGMLYYLWVDKFNTLGMGENAVVVAATSWESLLIMDPKTKKIYDLHVPYPMGFYHRGVEGRIDDAAAGWKGRGLWATYSSYTPWHYEGGKGDSSKVVHFQMRPDPLAK